jgi:tellurite resistance protein TehA-like permease
MHTLFSFLMEAALTLIVSVLIVRYLRTFLRKVLVDLCGTEDRAQFWTVFSDILLIGLPMIIALNYRPEARNAEELFFEVAAKLSGNLGGFLFALVGVGLIVTFFALVAPRRPNMEPK